MRPKKITLGQARAQGATALLFYCDAAFRGAGALNGFCTHQGQMALNAAIARWGDALRLDQVPARCTVCGARGADVRPFHPLGPGGLRRT